MDFTKQLKAAYEVAGGQVSKPVPEAKYAEKGVSVFKLKIRGYLGKGQNNDGDVYWITDKCVIAVEDAE
jgi:hypothetical protein